MPGPVQAAFDNHPIHSTLSLYGNELTEIEGIVPEDDDADFRDYVGGIRGIVDYTLAVLTGQDAYLVTPNMLEAISAAAAPLGPLLSQLKADPILSNARAAFEAAGPLVGSAALLSKAQEGALAKHAKQFAGAVRAELRSVLQTSKEAADNSQATLSRVAAAAAEAEHTVTNLTSAATEAARLASETATNEIATATKTFGATTEQLETQRAAALTQINEAMTGMESRFISAERTRSEAAGTSLKAATDGQTNLLNQITETVAKAEEALRLAGGAALSKRWIDQADYQRKERYFWVVASLGLVLLTLSLGILKLHSLTAPSDTGALGAVIFYFPQIPFVAASLTGIGFCISQASRRGLWEARDRRVANELTALPSFMDGMSEDARKELMKEVALRYFPGPEVSHDEPVREEKTQSGRSPEAFTRSSAPSPRLRWC